MIDPDIEATGLLRIASNPATLSREVLDEIACHPAVYPELEAWALQALHTGAPAGPPPPPVKRKGRRGSGTPAYGAAQADPPATPQQPQAGQHALVTSGSLPSGASGSWRSPAPHSAPAGSPPTRQETPWSEAVPHALPVPSVSASAEAPQPPRKARSGSSPARKKPVTRQPRWTRPSWFLAGGLAILTFVVGIFAGSLFIPAVRSLTAAGPLATNEPAGLRAAGEGFACAASGPTVECSGMNEHGEIGLPAQQGAPAIHRFELGGEVTALVAGKNHSCASTASSVVCWGDNRWSQTSLPAGSATVPVQIPELEGKQITGLWAGEIHGCAATANELWCWGGNNAGQLGTGSAGEPSGAVQLPLSEPVTPLSLFGTRFATCAILAERERPLCWGSNLGGFIDPANPSEVLGPTARA